VQVNTIKF